MEYKEYKVVEGLLQAQERKFAIVVSRFNEFFTSKLLDGALDALRRHGASLNDITVVWVPGAFEIPMAAQRVARSQKFAAVICLGAVVRGSTPHFDYVCAEVSKGVASVSLETNVPTIFGVLTTDTLEQAVERSGTKAGNKGWEAAISALEMADLNANLNTLL